MSLRSRVIIPALGATLFVTACDSATGPRGDELSLCHVAGGTGTIIPILESELASHLRHGDYVAHLFVSKQTLSANDSTHFTRIGDALSFARAGRLARNETQTAACRITISVDTGVFQGTTDGTGPVGVDKWPLIIDVPQISLVGSLKMHLDSDGRATGTNDGSAATTLLPTSPLDYAEFSQPLIIVDGHPSGSAGHGATVEGFVLSSGHDASEPAGQGVFALRVHDLTIAGNILEGPFSESIDLRASSGVVDRNFLPGVGGSCDICLAGPGDYQATNNRLTAGGIPGILIVAATLVPVDTLIEQHELPDASTVAATVTNNEVRNHLYQPVGAGLRVGAVGVGAPNVVGTAHVVAHDNLFDNNTFGVLVEAAFPVVGTALKSDIDLALGGNTISQSCQHDLLVAFSRHTTVLGLSDYPYLHNSHYTLSLGGDLQWADAWYGHPSGYGNTLVVDGDTIPNGARSAYDPDKICDPVDPRRYHMTETRASLSR
jgi:hypothetical protein